MKLRFTRTLLDALARAAILAAASVALAGAAPASPAPDEVQDILQDRSAGARARDRALRHLVELGPAAVPSVFAVLAGRVKSDDPAAPLLADEGDALLLDALRAWPADQVVQRLVPAVGAEATLGERMVAVRILGEVGRARSVTALIEVLAGVDSAPMRHRRTSSTVTSALRGILARDGAGFGFLSAGLSRMNPALLPCVAGSVAEIGGPRAGPVLARLIGRDGDLDREILAAFARLDRRAAARIGPELLPDVRALLNAGDRGTRKLAAAACGRLRDAESIPALLLLVDSGDAALARAGQCALMELSGVPRTQDVAAWEEWYGRETEWVAHRAPTLARELTGGDAYRATQAAAELHRHPLFSREVAALLVDGLSQTDPAVVTAICEALERLGDASAVPALERLAQRATGDVERAAGRALARLAAN